MMKLFIVALLALAFAAPAFARTFTIMNRCAQTVWPASLSNPEHGENPGNGGFELASGGYKVVTTADNWAGRFYPRTGCDFNKVPSCETGDCGGKEACKEGVGGTPPVTLAEFTLKGEGGHDYYDVSNVDGFSLPVTIVPGKQSNSGDQYWCKTADCPNDLNSQCPEDLKLKNPSGKTVGCKSACLRWGKPEYCCAAPDHDKPWSCPPSSYSLYFK